MPMTTDELDDHRLIVYSDGPLARVTNPGWLLNRGSGKQDNRRPIFKVNNTLGMLRAVESGIGIAALPDYIIKPDSKAVRVLPAAMLDSVADMLPPLKLPPTLPSALQELPVAVPLTRRLPAT